MRIEHYTSMNTSSTQSKNFSAGHPASSFFLGCVTNERNRRFFGPWSPRWLDAWGGIQHLKTLAKPTEEARGQT